MGEAFGSVVSRSGRVAQQALESRKILPCCRAEQLALKLAVKRKDLAAHFGDVRSPVATAARHGFDQTFGPATVHRVDELPATAVAHAE